MPSVANHKPNPPKPGLAKRNSELAFGDFQNLSKAAREGLAAYVLTEDMDYARQIAKDLSPEYVGMPFEEQGPYVGILVNSIILGRPRMLSMARCWLDCERDILLAKLTWSEEY